MKWETYLEYLQVLVRAHPDEINDDDSILAGLIEDTEEFLGKLKMEAVNRQRLEQ